MPLRQVVGKLPASEPCLDFTGFFPPNVPLRQVTGKLNRPIVGDRIYVLSIIPFLLMLHDDVSNCSSMTAP